jgi:ATP-dependent RNA helicase RhlE
LTFEDFNLDPELMEGVLSMGFKSPSPIQRQAIPLILEGKDMIACAQTGTGKTAAYLLPMLHKLQQSDSTHVSTLIIAPTRELALQIDQQIEALAYFCPVSSIAVYGGGDGITWEQQKRAMKSGTDIVTATPGRLIAMLQTEEVSFSHLKYLILDEADRMLDMGFHEDIEQIISHLPKERQTLLFSATMPPKIMDLAKKILHQPEIVNIAISKPAEKIIQQAYSVYDTQKEPLLLDILKSKKFDSVIIFAGTKDNTKKLGQSLSRQRIKVKAFHSDLEQAEREQIMSEFKSGKLNVLVGTDILSRGIDVEGIDLVINYDVPGDAEDYIHRIGRTARAAAEGTAITFINTKDQQRFHKIEKLMEREVPKLSLPEQLGEGPAYSPGSNNEAGRRPATKHKKQGGPGKTTQAQSKSTEQVQAPNGNATGQKKKKKWFGSSRKPGQSSGGTTQS